MFKDWGDELNCKEGERALTVTKLFVSSPMSTNTFCDHVNARYLQVPETLLRVNDFVNSGKMTSTETAVRSSRSRVAARAIISDSSRQVIYEFKAGARQYVVLATTTSSQSAKGGMLRCSCSCRKRKCSLGLALVLCSMRMRAVYVACLVYVWISDIGIMNRQWRWLALVLNVAF